MATVPEQMHESTIQVGHQYWARLVSRLGDLSPWLVVAAYVAVYTVVLAGLGGVTIYLAEILTGMIGVAVFFTVGIGLIAAAPTMARKVFARVIDAREAR